MDEDISIRGLILCCTRATKEIGDVCRQAKSCLHISNFWLTQLVQRRATKLIIKDRPYGERLQEPNLLSLASRRLFMELVFLFKCTMGYTIWICLIIFWQLTVLNIISDKLITSLQLDKIRNFLFFRVEKSWNSLPLHLRKAESLNDLKDPLKSLLHSMNLFFLLL